MKEGYAAADAGQAAAMRRQSTEFRMRGRRGIPIEAIEPLVTRDGGTSLKTPARSGLHL